MDTNVVSIAALSLISMCGTPSTDTQDEDSDAQDICWAYDQLLEVELQIGQECNVDTDCQQVLSGTGCGCETDDLIVNNSYHSSYFYDIYDNALADGCAVEFNTTCDCTVGVEPACVSGTCVWN